MTRNVIIAGYDDEICDKATFHHGIDDAMNYFTTVVMGAYYNSKDTQSIIVSSKWMDFLIEFYPLWYVKASHKSYTSLGKFLLGLGLRRLADRFSKVVELSVSTDYIKQEQNRIREGHIFVKGHVFGIKRIDNG